MKVLNGFSKNIHTDTRLFSDNDLSLAKNFDCGNSTINEMLSEKDNLLYDRKCTTSIVVDIDKSKIIAFYSLSCSAYVLVSHSQHYFYPAVEIKYFAVDKDYQDWQYSEDTSEGCLSNIIFSDMLNEISQKSETSFGADTIILYATDNAVNFYEKNYFKKFELDILENNDRFIQGCVPMYLKM